MKSLAPAARLFCWLQAGAGMITLDHRQHGVAMDRPTSAPEAAAIVMLLLCLGSGVVGCRQQASPAPKPSPQGQGRTATAAALKNATEAGHAATVRCLRSERALTDGDELRCEDWQYVSSNYTDSVASDR